MIPLLDWLHFLFLFLLFLHADALAFYFSFGLPEFFFCLRALAFVRLVLLSALVSRLSPAPWLISRRCSESNGSAPMRLVGISSMEGFACAHLRPITAITFPRSRRTGRFISHSRQPCSSLERRDGWRPEREADSSANSASLDRPSAVLPIVALPRKVSLHGCYERRALFQELYLPMRHLGLPRPSPPFLDQLLPSKSANVLQSFSVNISQMTFSLLLLSKLP